MDKARSILFVDDEEEILEMLVDIFSEEGYELHTASSAEQAKAVIEQNRVDFVLSDLKLPDASGKDVIRHVKDRSPAAVRVLSSGYFDVDFGQIKLDSRDGTFYLSKPWDLFALKQLVAERLA
ncbi:response regulator [bacterium]|nr:response regulator [bacterium]